MCPENYSNSMTLPDFSHLMTSQADWIVLMTSALLIGMSKTGIQGITTISIPLLALFFGAKESTGLILPMLCFADLIAVVYYRRWAEWKYILRLLPAAVAGFFVAILVDKIIPAESFKVLMGACIFAGVIIMLWSEKRGTQMEKITEKWWYSPSFGLTGGFTTMIGNAAGPIMSVFLLSMRIPKMSFVGTSAWFFLVVNYLKLPLQIFVWHNITSASITLNLLTIPAILAGAVLGVWFVRMIPERAYRIFIIVITILSALALIF